MSDSQIDKIAEIAGRISEEENRRTRQSRTISNLLERRQKVLVTMCELAELESAEVPTGTRGSESTPPKQGEEGAAGASPHPTGPRPRGTPGCGACRDSARPGFLGREPAVATAAQSPTCA